MFSKINAAADTLKKMLLFNFVHPKSNKTKPLPRFSKRYTFGASFNLFACFLKLSQTFAFSGGGCFLLFL